MKSWTYHNHNIMWPVILVAIAISYVICVLLLSGLQKEDLDPNTLEKLERHNVNIYDMNNDSLCEECLSNAVRKSNEEHVQQKYTSKSHLNEQINGNSVATNTRQIQINSPQLKDTASFIKWPQLLNGMPIKEELLNVNDNAKMFTEIENRHETTNLEHNTDKDVNLNKKSSLEIVLNFWNKIPRQTTEDALNDNKTIDLTRRQTAFVTPTAEHSKENDYVSRIIAEYIATQAATTKNLSIDFVRENLKHFREQQQNTKRQGLLRPFIAENNNENRLKNNIDTSILSSKIENRDYTPQGPLHVYSTPQVNFYNNKQIERHKDIQEVGHTNTPNEEILQNKAALKYLDDILRFRKQFNNDALSSHSENRIANKINNENHKISRYTKTENNIYKGSSSREGNGISSANFEIDNTGVINPQIGSLKDMQHIRIQANEALYHWDDILRTGKQFNIEIPNSEKRSLNKNNSEIAREQMYKNYMLQYISDSQNNEVTNLKRSQGTQSTIDRSGTVSAQVNHAREERLNNINTVNNKNIPKQAALEYLDSILRSSKKFNIKAEILDSERHNRDKIDCESDRHVPKNDMLTYNREIQNNEAKNNIESHINKLPNDHFERVSAEVNNEQTETLRNNSNTVIREYIQKQEALQYLDDILRFSKQFNTQIPLSEKSSQIRMNNDDEKHKMSRSNILQFIPELQNNGIKNKIEIQSNTTPIDHAGGISANVINEIAEKVKEILITDLKREQLPKTHELTTHRNTVITTIASDITTSIKDKLIVHQKDTQEKSEFSKTLLEILKEYKTLKDRNNSITTSTSNTKLRDKENSAHNENYNLHEKIANKEEIQLNPYTLNSQAPYTLNSQAIPWNFPEKPLLKNHDMQTNSYKSDYRIPPITIQTNSEQIAPLAIQLSIPMSLPNQNMISPLVKLEQPVNKQEMAQDFATKGHSNHFNDAIYIDLKPKAEKNTFRESYIDPKKSSEIRTRIQKLQNRIRYISEHNKQNENTYHPSSAEYWKNTIHVGVPSYHSLGQYSNINHEPGSKYRDSYDWQLNLLHRKYPNRPSEYKHHEPTNYEENLSRSRYWQHRDYLHRQRDKNHETKPFDFKYLNEPLNSQHRQLLNERSDSNTPKVGPRPRDVATSEILSKLMDSHHRNLLNRLIQSHSTERINRLTDHYRSSDLLKEYIRDDHPKAYKYHEKLEQSENFSSNNNDPYFDKLSTQTNCDKIASRQQVPLSVKNYQRTRFDDTHFKNFLKSQQKVTDLLEKILAAKTKPELHSVESV